MRKFFSQLKEKFAGPSDDENRDDESYVELESGGESADPKYVVRTFQMEEFDDVKPILDSLREGRTIALVNIGPLKEKDIVELKRAITKIKKTTDATNGALAGFGEDYLVATPPAVNIQKAGMTTPHVDEE